MREAVILNVGVAQCNQGMTDQQRLCTVDGCSRVLRARGYCATHWARWRRYGVPHLPQKVTYDICTAEDCTNQPRTSASPHCEKHYYRLRRTGKLTVDNPQRPHRGICTIEDCDEVDIGPHGLCARHRMRMLRHGDPLAFRPNPMPTGPDTPHWTGNDATYGAVHQRVKKAFGVPSLHHCVDCGRQAQHWSYDHTDPNQKHDPERGPYSPDITRYQPRCVRCHKRFDMNRIKGRRSA